QNSQESAQLVQAYQALAVTTFCLGEPAATRQHMEEGISKYDPQRHSTHAYLYGQDPAAACLTFGAVALWLLGHPDHALARSREAIALAERLGQRSTLAVALHFAAVLRQFRREGPEVHKIAESAAANATEHGLSQWVAGSQIMLGWAVTQNGAGDGIAELRQ